MNVPRKVLNAFTAKEVQAITGLSGHMVDYLARERYLNPTYDQGRVRGRIRFYSYRDLLVAKIVAKLLESGIELSRLKRSIQLLNRDRTWFPANGRPFDLLVTDGWKLYYHDRKGSLVELAPGGQRVFSFVLDVAKVQEDLKRRIRGSKRERFALENRPLIFAEPRVRNT